MERVLRLREASVAVEGIGWRFLLGTLRTAVAVDSLDESTVTTGP